jgi:HSP20 family protein
MSHVCYAPRDLVAAWTPLDALRNEVNRALGWVPPVDVRESEAAYAFEIEVPGLAKEDVQVEAEGNTVTIRGERKQDEASERGTCRRVERRYGRFERTFEIGDGFDAEKIDARLENGVLRVTLPKREESKPKHIKVSVN